MLGGVLSDMLDTNQMPEAGYQYAKINHLIICEQLDVNILGPKSCLSVFSRHDRDESLCLLWHQVESGLAFHLLMTYVHLRSVYSSRLANLFLPISLCLFKGYL